MSEKIINVDQIGDVTFRKNKRSKGVSIAIRPMKGVVVNLPFYLSYRIALSIVERKRTWILNHLPVIEKIENKATIFTEQTSFSTKYRNLIIDKYPKDSIRTKITAESIIIRYPENLDVQNPVVQQTIRAAVIKALRMEAKEYLTRRTRQLADKYQFKFKNVFIKNNKTLWGSCSGQNNINLNLHLMRLPDHLIDYVIIHELCHTVEKNHGPRFWKLMDTLLGDAKKFSKELKTYSIQIY